ncbi:hypothetical protein ACTOB_006585 [Actinoplanes oblitus]|uniref:Uncharacterized protein n=1 Tax=Actinoplanes oblitus TaxID=3040509 RepID=A0ABY8W9K3_9ACTN|nr:hypothetical protein [Actinoplanes oblitus]WIM94554.1 hypothetical protein ACTOB_006585 [Actinoplanes oblitus]
MNAVPEFTSLEAKNRSAGIFRNGEHAFPTIRQGFPVRRSAPIIGAGVNTRISATLAKGVVIPPQGLPKGVVVLGHSGFARAR